MYIKARMNFDNNNLNLEFVKNSENIELTDSRDGLEMYCYKTCSADSCELTKRCRGVAFEGERLVLETFGYTEEYTASEADALEARLGSELKGCEIYDSEEGALLRVWHHADKWYLSTHKKIDAHTSKWSSSLSFGQMFENALNHLYTADEQFRQRLGELSEGIWQSFCNTLDPEYIHTFLVRNTDDNRIVCDAPDHPTMYYTGSFSKTGREMRFLDNGVAKPVTRTFATVEDLVKYVETIDHKRLQGVIVLKDGKPVKIVNNVYQTFFLVRGNEPSVKFRYLQIRNSDQMVRAIHVLYPEHADEFAEYENILYNAARNIHSCYIRRFIRKEYSVVSKEEHYIVKECHAWHLNDRANNKVTLEKVLSMLDVQSAVFLNRLIKTYKNQAKQNLSVASAAMSSSQ